MRIIVSLHSFSCSRCPDSEENMLVRTCIDTHLHRETLKHIVMDVITLWLLAQNVLCTNYILCVLLRRVLLAVKRKAVCFVAAAAVL